MQCNAMHCNGMSCHVMSCHVMSCHVMSCHVMSCMFACMYVRMSVCVSVCVLACNAMQCNAKSCNVVCVSCISSKGTPNSLRFHGHGVQCALWAGKPTTAARVPFAGATSKTGWRSICLDAVRICKTVRTFGNAESTSDRPAKLSKLGARPASFARPS